MYHYYYTVYIYFPIFLFASFFSFLFFFLLPPITLQFLTSMESFQQFLSSHLDVLNTHPQSEDVIQLALDEDDEGDVYKQAEVAARNHDRQRFWLIWK